MDINYNLEGSTGTHSVFLEWKSHQIMYHVSTLLPYMEADEQKVILIIYYKYNTNIILINSFILD